MKKVLFLAVALLVFVSGCGRKAEEVRMPGEFEEMTTEVETMPAEGVGRGTEAEPKDNMAVELPRPVESKIESVEAVERPNPAVVLSAKPTVEEIQKALVNADLYQGKIDGVLGAKTKKAITDFQTQNNLKPDGKVGPKTWEKLKAHLNTAPASSSN